MFQFLFIHKSGEGKINLWPLKLCYSKCGPPTRSNSISQNLIRNAKSQAPPEDSDRYLNKTLRGSVSTLKVWDTSLKCLPVLKGSGFRLTSALTLHRKKKKKKKRSLPSHIPTPKLGSQTCPYWSEFLGNTSGAALPPCSQHQQVHLSLHVLSSKGERGGLAKGVKSKSQIR